MAEENKSAAQSKLGELFVDIGSSGLGGLLKNLNSLSASFLLTKNAAQQFTKPIIDMSKNAGRGIVGLERINAITGMTIKQLQALKMWSAENSVDFDSYVNQIAAFQQNLLDIQMGKGGNIKGFSLLGIDPRSLDPKKPLEALELVKKKVLQLDEATGTLALRELGLDSQFQFIWRRKESQLNKNLLLNKEEAENLSEQNTLWNRLGVTLDSILSKWISQQTWINTLLKESINYLNQGHPVLDDISNIFKQMAKWVLFIAKGWHSIIDGVIKYKNFTANPLNPNDQKNMTPEQQKKYNELEEQRKYGHLTDKQKTVVKAAEMGKTAIEAIAGQYNPFSKYNINPILWLYKKANGMANKNYDQTINKFNKPAAPGTINEVISSDLTEIPASLKNGNNSTGAYDLPAVPAAARTVNVTNNLTVNQDISGTNSLEIAARSLDKIEDSYNSLQRENLPGL